MRGIFEDYTDLIEPLSLDEAYLDVTHQDRYASEIAKEIRRRIFEITGLTASAGIAANKFLAKVASDWRKPNGQFTVTPDQQTDFLKDLPIQKIWGVGKKNAARLMEMGIHTCGDIQQMDLIDLVQKLGNFWL